ncbi:MAG: hypothetical protein AAB019_05780 [Planctomycetota bacterium]
MRTIIQYIVVILLITASAVVNAEESIRLSPAEWNAGEVEPDKEYRQNVKISLPTSTTGEITRIMPSCECLSAKVIKPSFVPGTSAGRDNDGEIEVILHVNQTLNTRFRIYLYIHINDDSKPAAKFNITGRIQGKGFNLGASEAVIFRTRVARKNKYISIKLKLFNLIKYSLLILRN